MNIDQFKYIVSTFSDPGSDILIEKNKALFSVNDQLFEVNVSSKFGDIYIDEEGVSIPASQWVIKRLANIDILAGRLTDKIERKNDFVSPSANLLPSLESQKEEDLYVEDALTILLESLDNRSSLKTTVLYLTSDAGEGKTWLINAAARKQATRFLKNESDWLLVPIILGGRNFLRFDDITVGMLQNKYRFPYLYYNSFLALVRMGVIVPAFDGFEEMFVENSSGEALSAMGLLVSALDSSGALLIAARKAYFDFENLRSQERLFDSISEYAVDFMKLELERWSKNKFIEYCRLRNISSPEEVYNGVKERLGEEHSLLTRPVLVRRLIDIAEASDSIEAFLEKLNRAGADFFAVFVRGIIEREANEKWIDRSGNDAASFLLTVDEHCELLSMVATEMWKTRVDYLKKDYLDVIAELFCEIKKKTPQQLHQIRERIRGHALLISSENTNLAVEFDHDEFRQFFLGEGLAEIINQNGNSIKSDVRSIVDKGELPEHSRIAFIRAVKRNPVFDSHNIIQMLLKVAKLDGHASYTQQNCSSLLMSLISGVDGNGMLIDNLAFGANILRDCTIINVVFEKCYFSSSSWETTKLQDCSFNNCQFGQIVIHDSTSVCNLLFNNCSIESVKIDKDGMEIWEPLKIKLYLKSLGAVFAEDVEDNDLDIGFDEELIGVAKLLRYFMRSTHISESVIRIKLSDAGQVFIDDVLPKLTDAGILIEIPNKGGTEQKRFKLGFPLAKINNALSTANGDYQMFLQFFHN